MGVENIGEFYRQNIQEHRLGEIRPEIKKKAAEVFGEEFLTVASPEERARAKEYIEGYGIQGILKRNIDEALGLTVRLIGTPVIDFLYRDAAKRSGVSGIYHIETTDACGKYSVFPKVRTLKPESDKKEEPFQQPTFTVFRNGNNDPRVIGKFSSFLRKSGLDELPQGRYLGRGMTVVGLRFLSTPHENGITRWMIDHREDENLGLSPEVIETLERYRRLAWTTRFDSAIIGVHAALGDVTHTEKLFAYGQYLMHASPRIDTIAFFTAMLHRESDAAFSFFPKC